MPSLSAIFLLPVWARFIRPSQVGKLDPKTIGVAVGITLISCMQAEIHTFEVFRPPSRICSLPVRSHSILMSPNEKLDPENIGIGCRNFVDILSGSEDTCI